MTRSSRPARVRLHTAFSAGSVDQRIFGGFLEHLGRAVYGGVYDPGGSQSDAEGFRVDVLEALRGLAMPLVRYPGGNYVSAWNWRDSVGPREKRPRRPDYAWQSVETNHFGIAEFARWCQLVQAKPMMAVNLGTGSAAEAAALVEYCNLPAGTAIADERVEHGRAQPYAISLWGLGNELDGPWQAGHVPAAEYARRAFQASFLMKQLDPSIETVAAGSSYRGMPTYLSWDREVLETCWDTIDYISAHRYSSNDRGDTAWYLAEGVELDRILADYAGVIDYVRGLKRSNRRIYLAFDEWNVWYRTREGADVRGAWTEAPPLLEERYNLEDAIVAAQYLMAFLRRADLVKVACLAQIVNVIAPIFTSPEGLYLQTIYHPFAMISRLARGISLTPRIEASCYEAGERGEVSVLDAAATYDESSGQLAAFMVNRRRDQPLRVELELSGASLLPGGSALALGGGAVDRQNGFEQPSAVSPTAAELRLEEGKLVVDVPAPGLVALSAPTRPL